MQLSTSLLSSLTRLSRLDTYSKARVVGVLALLTGYTVMLNFNFLIGVGLKVIAAALMIPWASKHKLWDVVALQGYMGALDLHQLILLFL